MKQVDAAVIGGGVLGCFAARNLMRWKLSACLLEAREDVCTGITRANSAIVYPGYDNRPGSTKARFCVAGNRAFPRLCDELEVPFARRGSLLTACGPEGRRVLRQKLQQGLENGTPGLRLLSGEEARQREPFLPREVTAALYAPTTATVDPWLLGIAAWENALLNGCEPRLNTCVLGIQKRDGGYVLETDGEPVFCKVVLNCAGLRADAVQELLFAPSVRLALDGADFAVLDPDAPSPSHIIFQQREDAGKGITAVPTVEGNLLLEGPARPLRGKPWATDREGLAQLKTLTQQILPEVDLGRTIRTFAAVRPNPHYVVKQGEDYVPDGRSIGDFVITNPAPGFYSLLGVKTPGLTCAQELGLHLARQAALVLDAPENPAFDPVRRAIAAEGHSILCQCREITEEQVRQAIRRGAVSVAGVKRRLGTGMGHCQGSRCETRIRQLLEEQGYGAL